MAKEKNIVLNIEDTLKELDKEYGKGSVIYGNNPIDTTIEVVSTGSLELDIATGIGGIPTNGAVIEIIGQESTGKSTLCQTIIGNFQKAYPDKRVILADAEHSLDNEYSTKLGINLKELIIIPLDAGAGEASYNKVSKLVKTGMISLVVYDSYNALQPKKIVDGEVGDNNLGLHARMLGGAVVKANFDGVKYGTTSIFIGQLREKIGVMFGSPETTQGGNALKFYSQMRMRVSRSTTADNSVMDGENKIGNLTKVEVFKNKFAPPFKKASFNIIYGEGIDRYSEIVEKGDEITLFKKYGKSITLDTADKMEIVDFITLLQDNEELFQEYRTKILNLTIYKNDTERISDRGNEE